MSDVESCAVCGFEWDAVRAGEVGPRIASASSALAAALAGDPALVTVRPSSERWSALEYGAHVRDVLLNVRDRLFVGLAEDDPTLKPMYRDVRIPFYEGESPQDVAAGLTVAAALFVRTFDALTPEQLERTVVSAYPREASRTLRWTGAQGLHEVEHHLTDADDNIAGRATA